MEEGDVTKDMRPRTTKMGLRKIVAGLGSFANMLILGTVIRAALLHCKLKPSVARITTLVTNLFCSKIQCRKSAEFYTYNWSILCN